MYTRNADLPGILEMLQAQNTRKHDIVVPASKVYSHHANLVVAGAEQEITLDGVTDVNGTYRPTSVADEHISGKLGIPRAYLRTMRNDRPDLYDANVNGWLRGGVNKNAIVSEPDHRSFLIRTFKGEQPGDEGIARAFLSDTYKVIDNLDVLMSALDGIRAAGVEVNIDGGDLTERRMVVRVVAPEVKALAPVLLKGYRSPFTGQTGDENPTVFAGFQISNSETGGGAFTIVPRLVVQVCNNGMTITKDALRNVHLGGKMEEGVIRWSDETQQKSLDLVRSRTTDAVRTFLDTDYMTRVIERAEREAGVEVSDVDHVRTLTKPLGYTEEQVDGILAHFIKGGQMTVGGVHHAATAYAQTVPDGDAAYDIENRAAALLKI